MAHAAGAVDVVVHNADGGVAAKAGAFQFQDWASPSLYFLSQCNPSAGLCLENNRFFVSAHWGDGASGAEAHPVPISGKSGYFWFDFSPSVEVVFKVLDGRTIDGHYWIHWTALTERSFGIFIIDRVTGKAMVYEKPAGSVTAMIDKTTF